MAQRPHSIAALIGEAERAISKARYDAALELLEQAALLAPEDAEIRQLLAQTERASHRHRVARARHETVLEWARKIEGLLERDDLEPARAALREAVLELGRDDAFATLEQRLIQKETATRHSLAEELAGKARALLDGDDWHGAFKVAEQSLRFAPVPEAEEVRSKAKARLDGEAAQQQYAEAIEAARQHVERLLEAGELPLAGRRLSEAIDQLGNHESFGELSRRIDRAKADLRFRQRIEWAERRAKEAEGLITEAARLSLQGNHAEAVARLEQARELDPSHPDLEARLETARAARVDQLARQQRAEQMKQRAAEIKAHLDALRLEEAGQAIRRAGEEFGEPQRFAALGTRLERLREAESSAAATTGGAAALDRQTETAILQRQQVLAAAYSWKQTLLYPFRGFGPRAFGILFATLVVLDVLAAIPWIGVAFGVLSALVLFAALGLAPHVLRVTAGGRNLLPAWDELADPARWLRDLPRASGLLLAAGLPLLLWLATRPWHGSPGADSGLFLWLAAALLAWLGAAFLVAAAGAAEAFGYGQVPRLARHARGLVAEGGEALLAIDGVCLLGLLIVLLAFALAPLVPWLFLPLARALEVYGLLAVPHLIGVLVRRHRLELSKIYRRPK